MRDDEVQVWSANLDCPEATLRSFYETLAHEERSHAARFKFPVDCRRFIARRGILRSLLAMYTEIAPARIELLCTQQGKPRIASNQNSRIQFNLSHSRSFALFAVTLDRDVGVDVEFIDPSTAWQDIAKAFFTACEQDVLARLPPPMQIAAFFEMWTRKESILKALGVGFQTDPTHINVGDDYEPEKAATLCCSDRLWKQLPLSANGFSITLTAAGAGWRSEPSYWPPKPSPLLQYR